MRSRSRAHVVLLLLLACALGSRAASGAPCAPARAISDAASLPDAWRLALVALVEASARTGLPWSCSDARLSLAVREDGKRALLTVQMAGWPALAHEVPSPEDLVPIGQALLARPIAREAPVPVPPPPPVPSALPPPPIAPRPSEPRLLIDAVATVRYSGHVNAIWTGLGFRVAAPIDAFSIGVWARYEFALAELQAVPCDFIMTSGSVGLTLGYRVRAAPLEIAFALEPSMAVITMDGGPDTGGDGASGAKGDFRQGARIQVALPFSSTWRGIVAVDGEVAPMAIASAKHRIIDPDLPPIPSFTLGLSLGGELVIR